MSDSDSEHEQQLTLEDLEGSDTEMISGDEDGPADIFTKQRVTVNNEVLCPPTPLLPFSFAWTTYSIALFLRWLPYTCLAAVWKWLCVT